MKRYERAEDLENWRTARIAHTVALCLGNDCEFEDFLPYPRSATTPEKNEAAEEEAMLARVIQITQRQGGTIIRD